MGDDMPDLSHLLALILGINIGILATAIYLDHDQEECRHGRPR